MFIVLEGLDGAGKSTQISLLRDMLAARGIESEYIHFPRFDAPVYGELVGRYLRGELGSIAEVDPYLVALIFAGDRADAAPQIRRWLSENKVVIVDRYVYSNIGFQCAKMTAGAPCSELADWILNLEYNYNNIPRPDISLFLDVPFSFTESKLTQTRQGDDRTYLQGAQDIHEASLALQQAVRRVYLDMASRDADLRVIDCSDSHGAMDTPGNNFAKICAALNPILFTDANTPSL